MLVALWRPTQGNHCTTYWISTGGLSVADASWQQTHSAVWENATVEDIGKVLEWKTHFVNGGDLLHAPHPHLTSHYKQQLAKADVNSREGSPVAPVEWAAGFVSELIASVGRKETARARKAASKPAEVAPILTVVKGAVPHSPAGVPLPQSPVPLPGCAVTSSPATPASPDTGKSLLAAMGLTPLSATTHAPNDPIPEAPATADADMPVRPLAGNKRGSPEPMIEPPSALSTGMAAVTEVNTNPWHHGDIDDDALRAQGLNL